MNYKVEGAIRRNKKYFIIYGILWVIITIVFVSPLSLSIFQASESGTMDFTIFFDRVVQNIMNPFQAFGNIFSQGAFGTFFPILVFYTVVYLVFFFIGIAKTAPKNEYTDIEHGSSDWSKHGEQYNILSKKKGIILAENNYLPVDKRGNVNVLVVGRFRFR